MKIYRTSCRNLQKKYKIYRLSSTLDAMYEEVIRNGDSGKIENLLESTAQANGYSTKGYHGTSNKGGFETKGGFSPEYLGLTTGAASAKEAFFFAKSSGTAAEYALMEAADVPYGDWFWQPKNANDLLGHVRDLMHGCTISGNKISTNINDMPSELWDSYGKMVQKFLKAETTEERRKLYVDFRNPYSNDESYDAVNEAVRGNVCEEAVEYAWDDYRNQPSEATQRERSLTDERRNILTQDLKKQYGEESFADYPSGTGLTDPQRFEKLYEKHPDHAVLRRIVEINREISELNDMEEEELPAWDELDDETKYKFQNEHAEAIYRYEEDLMEDNQALNIFSFMDEKSLPLDVFEWKNGFDPSDHSLDVYYLRMKNPYLKEFDENYRDEKFVSIIQKAKELRHDSVIFRDIRDGGGIDEIYAVFEPSQIKSGEDVITENDRMVPLSERFDVNNGSMYR